jgi:hypothetical protein
LRQLLIRSTNRAIQRRKDKDKKPSTQIKKEDDKDKKPSTQIQDTDNNVLAEDKIM